MDWLPIGIAILGALPGMASLIAILLKGRSESHKLKADAASSLVTSAVNLSEAKDKQIDDLRGQVASHENRIKMLEETVQLLEEQLLELGETPRNLGIPLGKKRPRG